MDLTKYGDIDQGAVAAIQAGGTDVQSLLFSKDIFKTLDAAKAWASGHGFSTCNADETATNWVLIQGDVSGFDATTLKDADFAEGVVAYVGKRSKKRFEAVFRFATIHRKDEKPHRIEGFVSIEGEDRQGDDIDPSVFNVEEFMARPTVFYEHKPWKTPEGNEVPVGHPEDMSIGIAHAIPDDDSSWLVTTENGTPLGVIEKRLNPGVKDGTRGLWVKVHITVDEVWAMIERGDVNAFSWYGEAEREEDTGEWLSVDMMEISPVMIGAHPMAGFSIAKAIAISEGKAIPDIELLSKDEVGKPLPNFHVCHLSDESFDGYFTSHASHEDKPYDIVWGQRNGKNEKVSIRYPRDGWTAETAQSHCRNNAGKFDPATGGEKEMQPCVDSEDIEEATIEFKEYVGKFVGSPRNPYGAHCSFGFKGGIEGYKKAWRVHFSQVNGGAVTAGAAGPIRGTVRRVAMIAAAMKPACTIAESENIGARTGGKSPLPGSYPEKPSDYGLSAWKKPGDDDVDREKALRFTCQDLNIIKRAATGEVKWRIAERERREKGADVDVGAEQETVNAELSIIGKFVEYLKGNKKEIVAKGGEEGMAEDKAKETVEETAAQEQEKETKSADDRIAALEKQFAEFKEMLEPLVSKAAEAAGSGAEDAESESPDADDAETKEAKSEEAAEEDKMGIAEAIEQLGKNDTALHEELGELKEELAKTLRITGVSRQLRLEKSHKKDAKPEASWTDVLWREAAD